MGSTLNGSIKKGFEKILGKSVDETIANKILRDVQKWLNEEILPYLPFEISKYKRDEHLAINTSITAKVEEDLKKIICPIIPRWMGPDVLTLIGFLGVVMVAFGYCLGSSNKQFLLLVIIGLIINWFGDSFDGSIARYWKRTRPNYGYYIDHLVDGISELVIGLGLGISSFVRIDLALLLVAMYLILETHTLLVKTVENIFKCSFGLIGPTEARIIMIAFTIYLYFSSPQTFLVMGLQVNQYDLMISSLILLTIVILITSMYQEAIKLHKQDTKGWIKVKHF